MTREDIHKGYELYTASGGTMSFETYVMECYIAAENPQAVYLAVHYRNPIANVFSQFELDHRVDPNYFTDGIWNVTKYELVDGVMKYRYPVVYKDGKWIRSRK